MDFGANRGASVVGEGDEPGVSLFGWGWGGENVSGDDEGASASDSGGVDDDGLRLPVASRAKTGVGSVVEFCFFEAAIGEGAREFDGATFNDGFTWEGEGAACAAMAVDEPANLGGGPAGGMAVRHFYGDAHLLLVVWDAVKGFLIAVENVVDVVGAVDEENGDAAVREVV